MFWSDALARATAFQTLASFLGGFDRDEVYTYGLLSQIGRLAFARVYPERCDKLLASIHPDEPEELAELERRSFNLDHNELAARMIADWRMPEIGCHAIRHQDAPESAGTDPDSPLDRLTKTLHLCGLIARIVTHPHVAHDLPSSMVLEARILGIPPEVTHHLFDRIVEEWRDTSRIFDISSRPVPSLAEIYIQAQQLREAMA